MRRGLIAVFVVGIALLVALATAERTALAGGKKGATGTIEIKEGKDGKYRFFVRDAEDKLLAMSGPTGFATIAEAQKAVDALKAVVGTAKVEIEKKDTTKEKKEKK